jgi:hypothetical protein
LQRRISAAVGLFSGGRHLTALVMLQSISTRPSSRDAPSGCEA